MTRELKVEEWLGRMLVDYEYRASVPLDLFDADTGLANQARLGEKLDQEMVERYALAMMDGGSFPALICWDKSGRLVPCDGNHRLAGAKIAGLLAFDAYVLKHTDRQVIDRITRLANILGGKAVTPEQAVEQAVWYVQQGHTIKEAAMLWLVKESRLAERLRRDETRTRLERQGVSTRGLIEGSLSRLGGINSDPVLKEAAVLVKQAGLTRDETNGIVKEIRDQRSEAAAVRVIADWRVRPDIKERMARNGPHPSERPMAVKRLILRRFIGQLSRHFEKYGSLDQLDLTDDAVLADVRHEWDELVQKGKKILYGNNAQNPAHRLGGSIT